MALIPYRAIATQDFEYGNLIAIRTPADAKPTDEAIPEAVPYLAARDEGVYPVGLVALAAKKGEIVIYFKQHEPIDIELVQSYIDSRDQMLDTLIERFAPDSPNVIDLGNIPHEINPDIYLKGR